MYGYIENIPESFNKILIAVIFGTSMGITYVKPIQQLYLEN